MSEVTDIDALPRRRPGTGRPTVIVDDLYVTYRVFATGRPAKTESRLRKRATSVRRLREVPAVRGVTSVLRVEGLS